MANNTESIGSLSIKVADQVTAMLGYWDKDLICRFANSAYLDWFGKTKDEMIDKISLKELLGPLFELNLPYIKRAFMGENQTFQREIPLPNGGTRHSLANYFPDIVNGVVVGVFVHVADVDALEKLKIELKDSNHTITEQNKRLLNFSNVVSHDLKSYCNNLTSVIAMLSEADTDSERVEMMSMVKKISNQFSVKIGHLNEMVVAQNQAHLSYEPINIFNYVGKVFETLYFQVVENNVTVRNLVNPEIIISANSMYIESILLNLATNAIKYRRDGLDPVITINSEMLGDRIAITIKDNGKGIDLEKYGTQLFGMYKTFHGNSDAQGIGLFITKYQIETMGGEIAINSVVGQGTTFTIYFKL